jgi:hypothetical protein
MPCAAVILYAIEGGAIVKFIQWNRTGVSRDVLCIGRWALKFPKLRTWRAFLIGLLANMQERDLWKRGDWPELLCPVVFARTHPVKAAM